MADPQDKHAVVEGDASKVPVRIAAGSAKPDDPPQRPTKGTHLVFGGPDPQSPWGQISALIGAGGSVPCTLVGSAVLAKAQAKGKKPGSSDKPKQDKKKDEPPPEDKQEEMEIHPAAVEDIFLRGEEFTHAKEKARVWAHPDTVSLGPRPLIVFLHGIERPQKQPYPQLQDRIDIDQLVHVGLLAKKLIDAHKVEPLIIAAPTCSTDERPGSRLWTDFNLGHFVDDVRKVLEKHGLQIDDDEVSVVGHSGAGCNPGGGLLKLAKQGAKLGDHELKVFGLADTCCTDWAGKIVGPGIAKLQKTVLYSLHRGTGGGGNSTYATAKKWADLLGATQRVEAPAYAPGEGPEISDYRTDGQDPPRLLSLKMAAKPDAGVTSDGAVFTHEKEWYGSGAAKKGKVGTHYAMTLNWIWYGLQRFYPRVSPLEAQPDGGGAALPQAGQHKAELSRAGDDWTEVPSGPPAWNTSGPAPRSNSPANFADPGSGRFWPVRTQSTYGRAVAYMGEDGKGYGGGAGADPTAQRHFLAPQQATDGSWLNAGVDLYADFGDPVVAPEEGVIARFDPLWPGVSRVLLHCSSGLVICCGGVDPDSLAQLGLVVGDAVKAGQPIGKVGRPDDGEAMLHFDTYPTGTPEPVPLWDKSQLDKVLDPTAYLLALARTGL
jgi:murein DD-endopeptidase MepM/ murein hydrolase activator NlpD